MQSVATFRATVLTRANEDVPVSRYDGALIYINIYRPPAFNSRSPSPSREEDINEGFMMTQKSLQAAHTHTAITFVTVPSTLGY
jgi:hypothetical protein